MAKFKGIKKKKYKPRSTEKKKEIKKVEQEAIKKTETPKTKENKKKAVRISLQASEKGQAVKQESPKNSRSITERLFALRLPTVQINHRIGLHAINILALLGLLLVGIGLGRYIEQAERLQKQKQVLETRLSQLENLAQKYTGFRDLYINIAIVSYEIKDFKKSNEYVDKALALDPNFMPALQLKGVLLTLRP